MQAQKNVPANPMETMQR